MGTLFDGYRTTRSGRKRKRATAPWDEMFPSDATAVREPYREIYPALARMSQDELRGRTDALASSYLAQGVTFDFAGEERPFPLDAVPRVIAADDWADGRGGRRPARARARGVPRRRLRPAARGARRRHPRALISSSTHFHRQAAGIETANGVRIHVSGIDLIRDEHGAWRVLEDNVRVPCGVSYVISNRRVMAQTLPELFTSMRVRPVGDYPHRLLQALRAGAPDGVDDPTVVVLTPGRLQLGVLRAHPARPPDGRRARRGTRPLLLGRPRVDAHDRGPDPRRRHLPSRRRRVPRPAAVPRRLDARRARPHARGTPRQRHDRERGRQRRRRRQARLHLRARPHPLLPRRGADPAERRHLAARGARRPRGGARPARRARREARRRLGRQGARRRPRCLEVDARTSCAARLHRGPARLDRAAGRAALDDPDARRRRHAPPARRPAAVRRQRRQRRLGAARRPHPRRAARGRSSS